jgi:hypothetical protein
MPDVLPLDRRRLMALGASGAAAAILPGCATMTAASPRQTVWTFDRLTNIGEIETRVEGAPILIDSPFGRAVQFDGCLLYTSPSPRDH